VRFASTLSAAPAPARALESALAGLREALGGAEPHLLACFAAPAHAARPAELTARLRAAFPRAVLLGCTARSVIGGGRELEDAPGIALFGASLPDVEVRPFQLGPEAVPTPPEARALWARELGAAPGDGSQLVLLADPWSADVESLLVGLDAALPGTPVVGGLASGGSGPGTSALWSGDALRRDGVVGVALRGPLRIDSVVAQGCRPIGQPMFVTRCQGQLLEEVDGRRPLEVLEELHAAADPPERELFRHSLFLGIEMRSARESYRSGDYLIRNLVGADAERGALAVAALLREREVVQFHLRDARSAADDLAERLARYGRCGEARGALLFSCLGRGSPLYGEPDHDSRAFRERVADVPIGGFFCNGEIGPVEGRAFLHGYTSAFAIFRAAATL
jgi:small ligand-binding sensory domain FIST